MTVRTDASSSSDRVKCWAVMWFVFVITVLCVITWLCIICNVLVLSVVPRFVHMLTGIFLTICKSFLLLYSDLLKFKHITVIILLVQDTHCVCYSRGLEVECAQVVCSSEDRNYSVEFGGRTPVGAWGKIPGSQSASWQVHFPSSIQGGIIQYLFWTNQWINPQSHMLSYL